MHLSPGLCGSCLEQITAVPPPDGCICDDSGPAARLVREGKDRGVRASAGVMASVTLDAVRAGVVDVSGVELITWIPHDPDRGRRRGYHLPQLYACNLARLLGVRAASLLISAQSHRQRGASRHDRLRNARGSICLNSTAMAVARNRVVLVVDDVQATGATLDAAAAALEPVALSVRTVAFAGSAIRGRPHVGDIVESAITAPDVWI